MPGKIKPLLFLIIFLCLPIFFKNAYACTTEECQAAYDGPTDFGWYACSGGSLCCYGEGCPSWVCGTEFVCDVWEWTCEKTYEWVWNPPVCGNWVWCGDDTGTYTCCDGWMQRVERTDCRSVCKIGHDQVISCNGACAQCPNEPPPPANNAPSCWFTCTTNSVSPGRTTACTINASDSENDTLTYTYNASCGTFNPVTRSELPGSFSSVYTPPTIASPTTCLLSATVKDASHGAVSCSGSVNMQVLTNIDSWITTINGDIYSPYDISLEMPANTENSWAGKLINVINMDSDSGGYIFTNNNINVGSGNETSKGGFAEYLTGDYNDPDLNDFVFDISNSSHIAEITNLQNLKGDGVYKISSQNLMNSLNNLSGGYNFSVIESGPSNQFITPVVYVTDSDTITLSNNALGNKGSLIIIIPGDLAFSGDAGIANPNKPEYSEIFQAGFIVNGNIYILDDTTKTKTLYTYGPLVTKKSFIVQRDLLEKNNQYPSFASEYVKKVYQLAKVARYYQEFANYLGFTTFDIQVVPSN